MRVCVTEEGSTKLSNTQCALHVNVHLDRSSGAARSKSDLLAYSVHAWSSAPESYGESRVISLDISKVFDRIWHERRSCC